VQVLGLLLVWGQAMSAETSCENCVFKSDGLNTLTPDYCYCHDMQVERDGICSDWRGSLRSEPVVGPPERALVDAVARLDDGVED
jgi:hypothetical protein